MPSKKAPSGYDRDRLELWVTAFELAYFNGLGGLNELVGFRPCPDQCGLRPERWVERVPGQKHCSRCGRFIGYIRKDDGK